MSFSSADHRRSYPYRIAKAAVSSYDLPYELELEDPVRHSRRRASSIAQKLGVDVSLVRTIATELGIDLWD